MWVLLLACVQKSPSDDSAGPVGDSGDDSGAPMDDSGGDSGDAPQVLYVSGYFSGMVHRYDWATGEVLAPIEGVPGAQTVVEVDGQLVIVAEQDNAVRLADPATGVLTGTLIADDPATEADETGGLDGPTAAILGPDDLYYVASFNTDAVLRYDRDGTYVDTFVAPGADGLDGPDIGLTFDNNGDLLVPGWDSNTIHRFGPDGTPGAPLLTAADGLDSPRTIRVDGDAIWVTSARSGEVYRVEPDGTFTVWSGLRGPTGLWLDGARVLISLSASDTVRAYDAETGEGLDVIVNDEALSGVTAVVAL